MCCPASGILFEDYILEHAPIFRVCWVPVLSSAMILLLEIELIMADPTVVCEGFKQLKSFGWNALL